MNNINFQQTGGFPLSTDILNEMQLTYVPMINGLAGMVGNLGIVSGCIESGNNISDGVVYVDGELLSFRGGLKGAQTTVTITEEKEQVEFANGQIKEVVFKRYMSFGSGIKSWNWGAFKRVFPLRDVADRFEQKEDKTTVQRLVERLNELEKKSAVFHGGGAMVFWNKPVSQIPNGWREVTDWRGRMPIGFDPNQAEFNQLGKVGGNKEIRLTINQLPPHSHGLVDPKLGGNGAVIFGGPNKSNITSYTGNNNSYVVNNTLLTGTGAVVNVLNPYRVVMFIEYIG